MPGFAKRLDKARVAPTVSLTVRARELRDGGANVVTLTLGEPDFAKGVAALTDKRSPEFE